MSAPISERVAATILLLNDAAQATTTHQLLELYASRRGQVAWNERVRKQFTARRLDLEREWVAAVSWELERRPLPCTRCGSGFVNARGHGTWCTKCVDACAHPGAGRVYGVVARRDGINKPVFACVECGGLIDARKADPRGEHVFRDLRSATEVVPCSRCGRRDGTQNHHWAPRAVFGLDAERWPQSPLCVECHGIWHRTMRRAGGYRLPAEQQGDTLPSAAACCRCGQITPRERLTTELVFGGEACTACAPVSTGPLGEHS